MEFSIRYKVENYKNFQHSYIDHVILKDTILNKVYSLKTGNQIINRYDTSEKMVEYIQTYKDIKVFDVETEKEIKNLDLSFYHNGCFEILFIELLNTWLKNELLFLSFLEINGIKYDNSNDLINVYNQKIENNEL